MAKLVDDLNNKLRSGGPRQSIVHEGLPCPFCDGERSVAVYLSVAVRQRQVEAQGAIARGESTKGNGYNVARPSFWQGACFECAASIQDEIAERAGRFDYLRRVDSGEGTT